MDRRHMHRRINSFLKIRYLQARNLYGEARREERSYKNIDK